ncbi:hypothetical protein EVG20_g9476 [Dentipellis fragilis]|uniref:Luciferase domain-containing protein n=1 Tax=Dentipellis fragilis TaxID=205917 RepID=A0A4Y9XY21_9AGAM|nr:hypothetical protein EVG20_g9476 [Dentipellis fragilis]
MSLIILGLAVLVSIPIYKNYRAYINSGPGGLPHNALGWLKATSLKPFGHEQISTEMYDEDPNQESWLAPDGPGDKTEPQDLKDLKDADAYELEPLENILPRRRGLRPPTSWHFIPHRQLADGSPLHIRRHSHAHEQQVVESLYNLARANPGVIALDMSPHERIHQALVVAPALRSPHATANAALREIAHVHESTDGSLHVVLAPADCKIVITHGWGQRHPLSHPHRRQLWKTGVTSLPKEYLMIYAPRSEAEVQIVMRIVRAAAGFMTGSRNIKG